MSSSRRCESTANLTVAPILTVPAVGGRLPSMTRSSVDLPAPFSPTMP